tara:strand:+ start:413 stop:559 length:147 start_codon:yes stop_codon:yes gene_type:complete
MKYTEDDMKEFARAYMSKCLAEGKVVDIDKYFLLEWELVKTMKTVLNK